MTAFSIAGEIELIRHLPDVFIEVLSADFIDEGICVPEEELDIVSIFLLQRVIMEPSETRLICWMECIEKNKIAKKW